MAKLTFNTHLKQWQMNDCSYCPEGFNNVGYNRYETDSFFMALKQRNYATPFAIKQMESYLNVLLTNETKDFTYSEMIELRKNRNFSQYDQLCNLEQLVHRAREVFYFKGKMKTDPNSFNLVKNSLLPLRKKENELEM